MKKAILPCLGLIVAAALAQSPRPALSPSVAVMRMATGETEKITGEINAYLQPYLEGQNFSGAVLLARRGEVLLRQGYGMANYELNVPNTSGTKFHIASVSKPFTAAAVLLLEERGLLNTSDPLIKFIPDYPGAEKMTLRRLLTHTSGIPNVNDLPEYEPRSRFPQTLLEIIKMFKHLPLGFSPGERYSYSNSNYNLLAYVIERASGRGFGDFLRENVFVPLEMSDTGHDGGSAYLIEDRASGYVPAGARGLENAPYLDWSIKTGNGSLYSTIEDLYKFDRALYGDKLLRRASRDKMFAGGRGNSHGWFVRDRFGRKVTASNGRSPGFTASLERFVEDDVCIIVLSNSYSTVAQTPIAADLAAIVLGEPYELPKAVRPVPGPAGRPEAYAGRYEFGQDFFRPGAVVTIDARSDHLVMDWGGGFQSVLVPVSESEFLDRLLWARVIFSKTESGQVTQMIYRSERDYPATKLAED